jgi:hypothetical protein
MQQSLVPSVSAGKPTMADIPDLPREERPPRVPVLTLRDRLDALQHRLQSRQHGRQPSQDHDQGLGL